MYWTVTLPHSGESSVMRMASTRPAASIRSKA
jgi:hypothetical protein